MPLASMGAHLHIEQVGRHKTADWRDVEYFALMSRIKWRFRLVWVTLYLINGMIVFLSFLSVTLEPHGVVRAPMTLSNSLSSNQRYSKVDNRPSLEIKDRGWKVTSGGRHPFDSGFRL